MEPHAREHDRATRWLYCRCHMRRDYGGISAVVKLLAAQQASVS